MSRNLQKFMKVRELIRQHEEWFSSCLPLVASENLTSYDVRKAISSDFVHRYAEGPPGARIYAGCRYMDEVESVAVETAKELFDAEFADVRPISGLIANLSVYIALTSPGDTILSLPVVYGGHISSAGKEENGSAWMVHGLGTESFVFDAENLNIDPDKSKRSWRNWSVRVENRKWLPSAQVYFYSHILLGKWQTLCMLLIQSFCMMPLMSQAL